MINLESDTPEAPRSCARFADGKFGIVMTAEKAQSDAEIFRWVAAQIEKGGRAQPADIQRAVAALKSFAQQFDMAAAGSVPKAP